MAKQERMRRLDDIDVAVLTAGATHPVAADNVLFDDDRAQSAARVMNEIPSIYLRSNAGKPLETRHVSGSR